MSISLESIILPLITGLLTFVATFSAMREKLKIMKKDVDDMRGTQRQAIIRIAQRDEEMKGIHARLDALESIKIEVNLAAINEKLSMILTRLEKH